jgi:hypothetical protein
MIKKDYVGLPAVGGSKAVPFVQKFYCILPLAEKSYTDEMPTS